jgi:hypothetical protein
MSEVNEDKTVEITNVEVDVKETSNLETTVKDDAKSKPSENEAKLLKEVMARKAAEKDLKDKLKNLEAQYQGIDVEQVKDMLSKAEATKQQELEQKGEFDRVKQMMVEKHNLEIKNFQSKLVEFEDEKTKLLSTIDQLSLGSSFSNSAYIKDKLILSPTKTRQLYGQHFEMTEGKLVGYDKPAGFTDRTPLVDSNGEFLTFDKALEAIIDTDVDKENILKSTVSSGSGSNTQIFKVKTKASTERSSLDKIAAGLVALRKK